MQNKPPAATVQTWLKNNLGKSCLAGLTSSDSRALAASVQIIECLCYTDSQNVQALTTAYACVVNTMLPHNRRLAYHAIAHVWDWERRAEVWRAAMLDQPENLGRCEFEPRDLWKQQSAQAV